VWCVQPCLARSEASLRGRVDPGLCIENGRFQRFTLQPAFCGPRVLVGVGYTQSVECEFVDELSHRNAVFVGVSEGFENRCHCEGERVDVEEFGYLGFHCEVCCRVAGVADHELGCAFGVFGDAPCGPGWCFTEGDGFDECRVQPGELCWRSGGLGGGCVFWCFHVRAARDGESGCESVSSGVVDNSRFCAFLGVFESVYGSFLCMSRRLRVVH